jgi:hypothetical protein
MGKINAVKREEVGRFTGLPLTTTTKSSKVLGTSTAAVNIVCRTHPSPIYLFTISGSLILQSQEQREAISVFTIYGSLILQSQEQRESYARSKGKVMHEAKGKVCTKTFQERCTVESSISGKALGGRKPISGRLHCAF